MEQKPDYTGMNPLAAAVIKLVPAVRSIKAKRAGADLKTFSGSRKVYAKKYKMRANGKTVLCKLYYPKFQPDTRRCMLYFHGGGFMFGGIHNPDGALRDYAEAAGSIVISIKYSLAPEFPYPNAVNECFHIARQVYAHAEALGIDASAISLAGDSAGGNLAHVTAYRLIEAGFSPKSLFLFYPFCELIGEDTQEKYPSLSQFAKGYFLDYVDLVRMTDYYVPDHLDIRDAMLSPINGNLSLLPPTIIFTAGFDPLKDMGHALYDRLQHAGVRSKLIEYPDMIHGFFTMFRSYTQKAIQEIIRFEQS